MGSAAGSKEEDCGDVGEGGAGSAVIADRRQLMRHELPNRCKGVGFGSSMPGFKYKKVVNGMCVGLEVLVRRFSIKDSSLLLSSGPAEHPFDGLRRMHQQSTADYSVVVPNDAASWVK